MLAILALVLPAAQDLALDDGAPTRWTAEVATSIEREELRLAADGPRAFSAPNRLQGLRFRVAGDGVAASPREGDGWELSLEWTAWGRVGAMVPIRPTSAVGLPERVVLDRGAAVEWYVHDERGLEQGFDLVDPPSAVAPGEPLILEMTLGGGLLAKPADDGQAVWFHTPYDEPVLRYGGLLVVDADGQELPARIRVHPPGLLHIEIDDLDARYPIVVDPILSSPVWTALGGQAQARFGWSVSTTGDVNGDGYSDVIVGAPVFDGGQTDEGRAFLFLGSASGVSTTPDWTAESNQAGAWFGFSVASAGDVNGDGFHDVLVGATRWDGLQADEGRAYLYLGSPSGLEALPAWTFEAGNAAAQLGYSVAYGGDVNGDGFDDVLVGARLWTNGEVQEGAAFAFHGSAAGLSTSPAWTIEGAQIGAELGASLSSADVNADGLSDAIVGVPGWDTGLVDEGAVFVHLGAPTGLAAAPAATLVLGQAGAALGSSVAGAGDVDGDGHADVLAGAPFYTNGESGEGAAFLFRGNGGSVTSTPSWSAEGDQDDAAFGFAVSTAGDVDGDGYADVLVGARLFDDTFSNEGAVFGYQGSGQGLGSTPTFTSFGGQANADHGAAVATAGDVDGDGFSDVLIGARTFDGGFANDGRATVHRGQGDLLSPTPDLTTPSTGEFAGDLNADGYSDSATLTSVSFGGPDGVGTTLPFAPAFTCPPLSVPQEDVGPAGDVNGDGYDDVAFGRAFFDYPNPGCQEFVVHHGSAFGLEAASAWSYQTSEMEHFWDCNVESAGDQNGDGYGDLAVHIDVNFLGSMRVFRGSVVGLSTTVSQSIGSNDLGLGYRSTHADQNGDGLSDLMAGTLGPGFGYLEGAVRYYRGTPSGFAFTASHLSPCYSEYFGHSVASAGDVDGDGRAETAVGTRRLNLGGSTSGCDDRLVVYGHPLVEEWVRPHLAERSSGRPAGDLNGDGYTDLIESLEGQFGVDEDLLYLGSASGLATTPAVTRPLNELGALIGDVNGDGFPDLRFGNQISFGNAGPGLDRRVRQLRADGSAPIAIRGSTRPFHDAFLLDARGRTAAGRGRVRLEWQIEPVGVSLARSPVVRAVPDTDTGAPGGTGSAAVVRGHVQGLEHDTAYHWRARIASDHPHFPRTPWLTLPWDGWTQTRVRTSSPEARAPDTDPTGGAIGTRTIQVP